MADPDDKWGQKQKIDSSAIIEMEVMNDDDDSDYETNFEERGRKRAPAQEEKGNLMDSIRQQAGESAATYMWKTGTQRARQAFSVYANIDILRPFFDVEPREVKTRLFQSLIPKKPGSQRVKVHRELYGPTMLVFTLIALLLFQMKTSGHTVAEGTLMGTAFGVCFGYWLGVASFVWFLAYVCNTHISMVQILSLLGYALFGHCVVLFMGTMIHTSHDHIFFYVMWAIFGGLATARMVSILASRTAGHTQKLIICGVVAAFHLLFLLYLHFAYHQIVEDLSSVINAPGMQHKIAHSHISIANQLGDNKVTRAVGSHLGPDKVQAVKDTATHTVHRVFRNLSKQVAKNDGVIMSVPSAVRVRGVTETASHLTVNAFKMGTQLKE